MTFRLVLRARRVYTYLQTGLAIERLGETHPRRQMAVVTEERRW